MNTLAALFLSLTTLLTPGGPEAGQSQEVDAEVGGPSTIHNVPSAHHLTLGEGAKVGILGSFFGMKAHPELYAGGATFRIRGASPEPGQEPHQGYWMALALHEIAPAASIYALDLFSQDEADKVQLIMRAMNWAVEEGLDAITYCAEGLSENAREILDPVLERTVRAGVVVVFVDYPHSSNLSPAGFGSPKADDENVPDLKIFSYDCTTLMADTFVALVGSDDDEINRHRPFLAPPSVGSVTAGLVALVRSVDPEASPGKIKSILVETSRPLAIRGTVEQNVPDALAAVTRVLG